MHQPPAARFPSYGELAPPLVVLPRRRRMRGFCGLYDAAHQQVVR
ncbi:hypothetical protein [Nocardiopsis quinghaiensis]|nr:hypothetical protein [Nocardiopsis quinghaiensis]